MFKAEAVDPTKKKVVPLDPNAPQGGDIYAPSGGDFDKAGQIERAAPPPAEPMTAPPPPPSGPMTLGAGEQIPAVGQPAAGPAQTAGAMTPQQADAAGVGWVPENHPLYGTQGFVGYQAPGAAPAPAPTPQPVPGAVPDKIAGPDLGPMTVPPGGGPAGHLGPLASADGGPLPVDPNTPVPLSRGEAAAPDPLKTGMRDALLKMLGQGDPTMDDPVIKAQSDAFSLAQTRAKQRDREAMASRAGASGQISDLASGGAFDEGLSNLEQRQGEAEGAHDSALMASELTRRRNELMSAASLAGNQMNEEDRLAFQKEFAQIDADLRKSQLAQQGSQFEKQYGLEGQRLAESIRQFDTNTETGREQIRNQLEQFKQSQAQQGRQFDVDAELKRLGIQQQGDLGRGDLDVRRSGIEGNLNLGLLSALLQDRQFGQGLSSNNAQFTAGMNNNNIQALLAALGQAG